MRVMGVRMEMEMGMRSSMAGELSDDVSCDVSCGWSRAVRSRVLREPASQLSLSLHVVLTALHKHIVSSDWAKRGSTACSVLGTYDGSGAGRESR